MYVSKVQMLWSTELGEVRMLFAVDINGHFTDWPTAADGWIARLL